MITLIFSMYGFNLSDSKPLLLVNDPQVLFNPLGVEIFVSAGLQLEGVLLEILKPNTEKHIVC